MERKKKMGQGSLKKGISKFMGLAQRPISPKSKNMVIGLRKPKGFSKKPMGVKEVGKDEMGLGRPKNEMGQGSPRCGIGWPSRNARQ